ncbi:hypothetical protein TH63_16135 [Rufibacter radiotolerans]|uniref:Uncharacterized protein n=1 Tax=Rufibacter radiotolerans TaxID=1379910 RepID=A0A0H4VSQ6_9BACT|nr:hypothetical protein TH63_16135 [Rufibacter radiotolerans]
MLPRLGPAWPNQLLPAAGDPDTNIKARRFKGVFLKTGLKRLTQPNEPEKQEYLPVPGKNIGATNIRRRQDDRVSAVKP